jgi:hypothetical protein
VTGRCQKLGTPFSKISAKEAATKKGKVQILNLHKIDYTQPMPGINLSKSLIA